MQKHKCISRRKQGANWSCNSQKLANLGVNTFLKKELLEKCFSSTFGSGYVLE